MAWWEEISSMVAENPVTAIACSGGWLILLMLAGSWRAAKSRQSGKRSSVTPVLTVAVISALSGGTIGFGLHSQLDAHRDFARAENQFTERDTDRETLYDQA